jgi:hypothetical protein
VERRSPEVIGGVQHAVAQSKRIREPLDPQSHDRPGRQPIHQMALQQILFAGTTCCEQFVGTSRGHFVQQQSLQDVQRRAKR